jgi:uncharacterized protein YqgC (DUF456 family)
MMEDTVPAAVSPAAAAEVPGYLPVSRLAVGALVLGLFSALALVSPFFLVVPLVALAVSVAGCADCDRAGAPKAGRLAAIVGLALSIGFAAQALSTMIVARSITAGRAVAAAEIFLTAVRDGRSADAEAMCSPEAQAAVATLAACGARGVCRGGGAGDEPGTWVVRIVPTEPGECGARLVLAPAVGVQRGGSVERWLVTACDVEGQAVRPSGT